MENFKQNSVALSTCEAELITISLANQEALYLRALLNTQQLFIVRISSVLFWQKTQSSIKDQNIDIKFQFICDERVHSFRIH